MGRRRRQPCGFGVCRKAHDLTLICALVPYLSSRIPKGTTVFIDGAAFADWTILTRDPRVHSGRGVLPALRKYPSATTSYSACTTMGTSRFPVRR